MSEAQGSNAGNEGQARFNVLRVYAKDISFESPASPGLFLAGDNWRPRVNVSLETAHTDLGQGRFESVLKATLRAEDEAGKTSYIVEVQQAGLFEILGVNEEQLQIALEINCPNTLFPYVRERIDTLLVGGTFPPSGLGHFSFEARYAEIVRRRQAGISGDAVN